IACRWHLCPRTRSLNDKTVQPAFGIDRGDLTLSSDRAAFVRGSGTRALDIGDGNDLARIAWGLWLFRIGAAAPLGVHGGVGGSRGAHGEIWRVIIRVRTERIT